MKAFEKTFAGKVTNWSIVGVVVAGTLLISGVADISQASETMAKIFLVFLAAVIVVQVIPGLLLLGAMFKGVYSLFDKKAKATAGDGKK